MKNILVVEDEQMVASVLAEFLEKKGYDVTIANTLSEGREKYSSGFDMVLLDIVLRDETSFPLLQEIKERSPDTPVLIFSGYDSEENIRKAKSLGADGFIPKPFRLEFLEDFLVPKIDSLAKKANSNK